MTRVYLASPFFNDHEIETVAKVEEILRGKGLNVWSPREHQLDRHEVGSQAWSLDIFHNDIKFIRAADIMVTVYHGNYSDSGTAFECGVAYACNVPNIVVHVGEDSNLMIHEGAHANVTLEELKDYDFEELASNRYSGKMF
ncbi:nucleoside 2-deoxyribosyltransferase [Bacillus testis]|uniref:nucleoside 2-deoxyribosyltransferase n=1 Tax=Bacillus testis TaxID=1622072 RepID=UPI00067ECC20|nr:nucleoside 2-deoxyribosyltransferase [Bacillus testis]